MSTRTGHKELSREEILSRFASLTGKATRYIEEGQRTPEMIDALLESLQRFRDNTLMMPIADPPREVVKEIIPANMQAALSTRLRDTGIDERLRSRFVKFGILYVGEIYSFPWRYGSHENHIQGRWRRDVEKFLAAAFNLPPMADLKVWGWRPPYDTAQFRALLDKPPAAILKPLPPEIEQHHAYLYRTIKWGLKQRYAGEVFTKFCKNSPRDLEELKRALNSGAGVHAGMWIPDWTPPTQ